MTNSILVPVDGSAQSKKALEFACRIADKFDSRVYLLHVAQALHQDKTLVLGAAAVTIHSSREELEQAGRKVLDSAEKFARESGCASVERTLTTGDPAEQIVKLAKDKGVEMVVLGSRGLSDLSGLMLGSVSHKVSHLAPCTCVTVR